MKTIMTLCLIAFAIMTNAQDKIPTLEEARLYFKNATIEDLMISSYSEEDGELYNFYSSKNPGDIIITGNEVYQVEGQKTVTLYNYSLIILDNTKQKIANIEKLQKTIIAKHNFGVSFKELAEKYANPETAIEDISLEYEMLTDGLLKDGIDTHSPGEMFVVEFNENVHHLIVINGLPVMKKAVVVKKAMPKF